MSLESENIQKPGLLYRKSTVSAASVCMILIAVTVIGVLLTANLIITKAGNPAESNAVATLLSLYPFFAYSGAAATVAFLVFGLLTMVSEFRLSRRLSGLVMAVTLGLVITGTYPVLKNAFLMLPIEKSTMAGTTFGELSITTTAISMMTWTIYLWFYFNYYPASPRIFRANRRILRVFNNTGPKQFLTSMPSFLLIAGIISTLAILIEVGFHTGWIVRDYNISDGLISYWLVSMSAAMIIGIMYSLILIGLLLVPIVTVRVWRRILREKSVDTFEKHVSAWIPRVTGLLCGLCIVYFSYKGVTAVFYDELHELRMVNLAGCAMMMLGILIGNLVAGNLQEFCSARGRPKDFPDIVRIYLLCLILWPIGPISRLTGWRIRINRRLIVAACVMLGIFMAYLILQSFPSLYDITSRATSIWSVALIFSAMTMGYLIFPPQRRFWALKLLVVIALFIGSSATMATIRADSSVRLLFYEYSSLSRANFQIIDTFLPEQKEWYSGTKAIKPPKPKPSVPENASVFDSIRKNRPLIVFVIMDACRPDRMGVYGYDRLPSTTENMDRYRDKFILFRNAISQATATTCSMRHFFTAKYSSRFMVKKTGIGPFFLNELLEGGYHTLLMNIIGSDYNGISSMAFMREMPAEQLERIAYSQDGITPSQYVKTKKLHEEDTEEQQHDEFELIDKLMDKRLEGRKPVAQKDLNFISFTNQGDMEKVQTFFRNIDEKFKNGENSWDASGVFAFIHMHSTHFPWKRYHAGRWYGEGEENVYDHTVSFTDACVGKLLDGMHDRGILDNSIIILAADHGTGLNEHGRYGGFNPYIEQIRIPLMVHVPGIKGGREVSPLVGLFDIGPTLVAPFNTDVLEEYDGVPLWSLLLGKKDPSMNHRVIFSLNSFADSYSLLCSDGAHFIWQRTDRYDLLFDAFKDPEEYKLLMNNKSLLTKCRGYMKWFLDNAERGYDNPYHYKEKENWR